MPEHEPLRLQQEAFEKLLREPITDAKGRIKYIVLLDDTEVKNAKDKGVAKKRVDSIARSYHYQKTKETIAQLEVELSIEATDVLSTLVEGFSAYLNTDQKSKS